MREETINTLTYVLLIVQVVYLFGMVKYSNEIRIIFGGV